ncbi:hypothetical protein Hypma_004641 [Hypsizygus marmoreus]|uniref:Tyr recombinase domain-containing protein n=1 Tax=Hypsizygus marmoreus TaxID=39966 RepID=A0A369J2K8_HYPMA|nr:hypothetical protein Hypma_004641 [Hypsizygus marmoreus]
MADTLSLFTVYMCAHIKPTSVASYLSGICQQLEPYFPEVRHIRKSSLVSQTLAGCQRLRAIPTTRKRALTIDDLDRVVNHFSSSTDHNDRLFVAQLLTGFFALMRLGELTYPDNPKLRDDRKVIKITSVTISDDHYKFFLPGHKADKFFEGNTIIIRRQDSLHDPFKNFGLYLLSRHTRFPLSSELWLTAAGRVPTRSFFINRIRKFFDSSVAGQSMCAGGATHLTEQGVAPSIIQAIGRWATDTFQIYIRKSPVLIQALLFGRNSQA